MNKQNKTYYSSGIFGCHIVGSLLSGLLEALFGHFHPEGDQQQPLMSNHEQIIHTDEIHHLGSRKFKLPTL